MNQLVVVGYPLDHSVSPVMHNAALSAMGLGQEFRYGLYPLSTDKLGTLVEAMHTHEIAGANITIPYKTQILKYIDGVTDLGNHVGSVNTLFDDGNSIVGTNTDVIGLTDTLHEHSLNLCGSKAIILGAGGAARAVAFALAGVGVREMQILNRTRDRADVLVQSIRRYCDSEICTDMLVGFKKPIRDVDIVVNCTPVGMRGHSLYQSPLSKTLLHQDLTVMDLVYNPLHTRLLRDAEAMGCKTVNGGDILVHQGAESLQIWTGRRAPIEAMRAAVHRALGEWDA
jgi:shikimate dehydrogenase